MGKGRREVEGHRGPRTRKTSLDPEEAIGQSKHRERRLLFGRVRCLVCLERSDVRVVERGLLKHGEPLCSYSEVGRAEGVDP